jgi:integrase
MTTGAPKTFSAAAVVFKSELVLEWHNRAMDKMRAEMEGSCRLVIAAIRALLRFLAAEGVVPPNLHRAVPVVREWRHASLPQYISTEELERVLQICRAPTPGCSRDGCIILTGLAPPG